MLKSYYTKGFTEAGCDEAGRGCLAGPVVAAAVILPKNFQHKILNDSKKLNEQQRISLRTIIEKKAITWGIGISSVKEIDEKNILNASFLAMHRAINQLTQKPKQLLIDGNRFKSYHQIPHICIIKGDEEYLSIAAASILAKTHRDEIMMQLHDEFPEYNWKKNKGYPTREHRNTIQKIGTTSYHRKTFKLLTTQFKLNL